MPELNGKALEVRGKNLTVAEVHGFKEPSMSGLRKVKAVLHSWCKAVLVDVTIPKDLDVEKGSRLIVEANLGALYVDELNTKFIQKVL